MGNKTGAKLQLHLNDTYIISIPNRHRIFMVETPMGNPPGALPGGTSAAGAEKGTRTGPGAVGALAGTAFSNFCYIAPRLGETKLSTRPAACPCAHQSESYTHGVSEDLSSESLKYFGPEGNQQIDQPCLMSSRCRIPCNDYRAYVVGDFPDVLRPRNSSSTGQFQAREVHAPSENTNKYRLTPDATKTGGTGKLCRLALQTTAPSDGGLTQSCSTVCVAPGLQG